jgi:hypothetical protein
VQTRKRSNLRRPTALPALDGGSAMSVLSAEEISNYPLLRRRAGGWHKRAEIARGLGL